MSYIGEVATDPSFQPFTVLREQFGFVPHLFRAQAALPRAIEAEAALLSAILFTDKALTRTQKECALLMLAAAEGNSYCFSLHYQTLKLLGIPDNRLDRIVADYQRADLSPSTQALLTLVFKLGTKEVVAEASAHGLSNECILDAILTAGLSRFLCVLATGVGVIPDFACGNMSPQRVPSAEIEDPVELFLDTPNLPDDFPPLAFLREQLGSVPKVFQAQTLRPDVLETETDAIRAVLLPEDALTRAQKEGLLFPRKPCNDTLRTFAQKLAADPKRFSESDIQVLREQGFTEPQILDAVATTALGCFFDVVQAGLGAGTDFIARKPVKIAHLSPPEPRPIDVGRTDDPDAECVVRVQRGDLDAFEELMLRHNQRVYRTLVGILGNPDEARDAMQDTFLKAFEHMSGFEGRSKFSTWLLSIASNAGIQRLRERRPMESLDESGPAEETFRPRQVQAWTEDPEQLYSQTEMRALVENGVMRLPVKYRMVLMLRDIEQLPIEEAASALGLGIPAIKARLLRGRLMLREALAPHFIQSGPKGRAKG